MILLREVLNTKSVCPFSGYDCLRSFDTALQDDLMYSSDDDDDDDGFYQSNAAFRPLEPHPRIRQLTDEVMNHFHIVYPLCDRFKNKNIVVRTEKRHSLFLNEYVKLSFFRRPINMQKN